MFVEFSPIFVADTKTIFSYNFRALLSNCCILVVGGRCSVAAFYVKKFFAQNHCVKSVQIGSFFWSLFSRIRTEYGEIRSISPYSVRMPENTDQKKLPIWTDFTQWIFWLFRMFCHGKILPFPKSLNMTLWDTANYTYEWSLHLMK